MKLLLAMIVLSSFAWGAETAEKTDERSFCNVSLFSGSSVVGNRCRFFDEVMTGIVRLDPLTIRCSRLNVTCNRDRKVIPVTITEEKEND